jgi:hypothetical protein
MITSLLLLLAAEALFLTSWALAGWLLVVFLANAVYFPLVEEKTLERRFGDQYQLYKANVPRWIPRKGMAFLKALVGLCRELDIGTVIEMVDSPGSLQFARACGADYVQGYLFGKPHADIGLFEQIVPLDLFRISQPM